MIINKVGELFMAWKWELFFLYLEFDLSETSKVCFGFIEFSIQNFV
jgi:hypothetical protein